MRDLEKKSLNIPGVEKYFTGSVENINRKFNLITILHVLEHIPEPTALLEQLHPKLTIDGILVVQVPNFLRTHLT
jgi:2-polyprenyl-3-methyl-5-hydroxy-6-metoxy-1,4-benzoquinol methylase